MAIKGDDPAGGRSQARANGSSADNHNVASEQDAREQDGKREKTNAVGENKGDARPHTRPGDEQGANSQGAPESEKLTDKEARRLKEIESDLEAGRELTDEQKRFLGEFSAKHGREIQAALKGTLLQRLFLGMSPDDADDTTDTGLDAAYQQRLQRAFQTNRDNPLMGDPTGTAWHFGGLAGGLAGAAEAGMSLEGYYESIRSGESASVAGIFLKSVPIGAFMAAKGIVDAMAHLPTTVRSVGRLGAMALDGGLGEILNMQLKAVLNADPEDQAQMLGEFIGQWGMGELIANPGNAKWLGDRLKMLGQAAGGNLKDKAVALAKGAPDAWSAAICMRHGGMTMKEITAELLRNPNNYCFIEETPVHTPQGIVPIENLNAGDHVKSCVVTDHPGSTAHAAIGETSEGVVAEVIALVFPDEAILCTPAHPFFVLGKGWTEAADMRPGDRIPDVEGRPVSLKSSETRSGKFRVFNFTTPGLGTYFVGNSGLLVHNGGMACSVKHVQDFAKNVGIFEDLTNEQVDMFRSAYAMYDEAKQRFNKPWLDRPALRDDFVRAGHLLADDVVHHKIPLEVLWKFPGVFKPGEINSWNNFMGMQKKVHVAFSGYWREAIPRIWKMLKDDGVKLDQPEFAHKARIYIEAARDLVTPENAAILKDDSSLFVDGLRKQAAGRQPFP
ncbi:MAG TPA: Hint domain-containing protein [Candidatus Brocadiia bacterium]|nr:Hint domain-containing protein [Candidatus Brocadiia bacterium]